MEGRILLWGQSDEKGLIDIVLEECFNITSLSKQSQGGMRFTCQWKVFQEIE